MQGILGSSFLKSSPVALGHFIKAGGGSYASSGILVTGQSPMSFDPCGSIQLASLALGGVRWKHSKKVNTDVQKLVPGGVQYPGFTYFPRFPDQKDPPYEPTKLLMVKRIRSVSGCPWWEKEWIEQLKLGNRGAVAIVKNTPTNNARLYRLKHLIEIKPISTPYGMPDEPQHAFLKENGEFVSYSCIEGHKLQLEDAEEKVNELKKASVDGETLKYRLKTKWYSRW